MKGQESSWKFAKVDPLEKTLQIAIFRCTVETESGKVDEIALFELITILKERTSLISKAVALIKERISNPSPSTCCMAMILLAELMQCSGYDLHRQVQQAVLHEMMKLAVPCKGTHPRVQMVASTVIKGWGVAYGKDPRLVDFADAARRLSQTYENSCPLKSIGIPFSLLDNL